MASFSDSVFQIFEDLIKNHRFVRCDTNASKRFVSMIRYETEDVFVYLFVKDGRPSGANLDVDIWIAPPDEAGDGLDNLYVGYKVRIGSEYEIDDSFFINCSNRIIHFLSCVPAIAPLIIQEMKEPYFKTRRWKVYQIERSALMTLLDKARAGDATTVKLLDDIKRLSFGKNGFSKLEAACMPIAVSLLEKGELDKSVIRFFDGDANSLASTLAKHLHIRELGERSAMRKDRG